MIEPKKSTAQKLREIGENLDRAGKGADKLGSSAIKAGCGIFILLAAIMYFIGC